MEILNLKDFKEKNPGCVLEDYLEYLEELASQISHTLSVAESSGFPEEFLNDITKKYNFVNNFKVLVKNSLDDRLIDAFSKKDLETYIDKDKESILDKIRAIDGKVEKLENDYNDERECHEIKKRNNACDRTIYEKGGAGLFFELKNYEAEDIVRDLIISDEYTKDKLAKLFKEVIDGEVICSRLVDLIWSYRLIVGMSANKSEALKTAVNLFFDHNGVGAVLGSDVQKFIEELRVQICKNTDFFIRLDDSLKSALLDEDLKGTFFQHMEEEYGQYLKGEELFPEQSERMKRIEEELIACEEERSVLSQQLVELSYKEADFDDARDYIKNRIRALSSDRTLTYGKLLTACGEPVLSRLKELRSELEELKANKDGLEKVLQEDKYNSVFEYLEKDAMLIPTQNETSIYDKCLNYENNLASQIDIVCSYVFRCEEISEAIKTIRSKKNLFGKLKKKDVFEVNDLEVELGELYAKIDSYFCEMRCQVRASFILEREGLLSNVLSSMNASNESFVSCANGDESKDNLFLQQEKFLNVLFSQSACDMNFFSAHASLEKLKEVQGKIVSHLQRIATLKNDELTDLKNYVYHYQDPKYWELAEKAIKLGIVGVSLSKGSFVSGYNNCSSRIAEVQNEIESLLQNDELVKGISLEDVLAYQSMLEGIYEIGINSASVEEFKRNL